MTQPTTSGEKLLGCGAPGAASENPLVRSGWRRLRKETGWMILVVFLLGGAVFAGTGEPAPEALPRVRLSGEGRHFIRGESGERFVPWGFNYLGRFGQLAEDDWESAEGWKRIEKDFREMRTLGANVVRWHLQLETYMQSPERVDREQLARLQRLLQLARRSGVYLDLTGLNCYRRAEVPPWYDELAEAERWKVQARFWAAIAETCAEDPVVFCYSLMNEPVIGSPAPGDPRWLTGELGGFYFVQRISYERAGREPREIAASWVKQLTGAIRGKDRATLTTVGVIPWAFVWPGAKPVFYSPETHQFLDFVSIHVYPETGKLRQELSRLAAYELGKPLVIEEIFPLKCSVSELDLFVDATTNRVAGWMSHYFGQTVQEHQAGAAPSGKLVSAFLEYWAGKGKEIGSGAAPEASVR